VRSCLPRAATPGETDWKSISSLYDVLAEVAPGPVVEVNRAVAHGRAFDAGAGLAVLDALPPDALAGSPLVPSVRGDLLARLGHHEEAAAAFREAAMLSDNQRERELLLRRAEESRQGVSKSRWPFLKG
jgi:predicted RNA polymerase sigma factor